MKQFKQLTMAMGILLLGVSIALADDIKKPVAFVEEPVYTFPATVDGSEISHDFMVANKGDATLVIEKVRPTCGCTTTSFTKKIEPGEKGEIKTLLKTTGQGGRHMKKTVHVSTNDPANKSFPLTLTGDVRHFAEVHPTWLRFQENGEDRQITINPLAEFPFKIKDVTVQNKKELSVTWKEVGSEKEKHFEIMARNLKKDPGRIHNRIVVHTDSPVKPEIVIRVSGFLKSDTQS